MPSEEPPPERRVEVPDLLAAAEEGPAEKRKDALERIAGTSLAWIPTEAMADLLDRLLALAEDREVAAEAVLALERQIKELLHPDQTFPEGYREVLVSRFLDLVKRSEGPVRPLVVSCLGTIGQVADDRRRGDIVHELIEVSRGPDVEVRTSAAFSMGDLPIGPFLAGNDVRAPIDIPAKSAEAMVERLLEMSEDESEEVAYQAGCALGTLGSQIPRALRASVLACVLGLMEEDRAKSRAAALFATTRLYGLIPPTRAPQFVDAVIRLSKDAAPEVRSGALHTFGLIDAVIPNDRREEVLEAVLDASRHDEPFTRKSALLPFGLNAFDDHIPEGMRAPVTARLLEMAEDDDEGVRWAAILSLKGLLGREVVPPGEREAVEKRLDAEFDG